MRLLPSNSGGGGVARGKLWFLHSTRFDFRGAASACVAVSARPAFFLACQKCHARRMNLPGEPRRRVWAAS
jgi:hypothetical protein